MNGPKTIAVIVGSLRKKAASRKIAHALSKLAPDSLKLSIVEIGDLPLYNSDVEAAGTPQTWTNFRNSIKAADGVLFVTPEFNRSMPGALKNALDIGSRPYGQSAWNGKPSGVISHSVGGIGGFGANHHVRQTLVHLNAPAMHQPEAYIGSSGELFDDKGELKNYFTRQFLKDYMTAYASWVGHNS